MRWSRVLLHEYVAVTQEYTSDTERYDVCTSLHEAPRPGETAGSAAVISRSASRRQNRRRNTPRIQPTTAKAENMQKPGTLSTYRYVPLLLLAACTGFVGT